MRALVLRALEAIAVPTVAFVAVALLAPHRAGLAAHVYVLVLLGFLAVALVGALGRAYAAPGASPFEAALARGRGAAPPLAELARLEREVTLAAGSAFDEHFRLRPTARAIAGGLLATRHGVDLDRDPQRARALLGDEVWELVRGDRPPPEDRHGPGIGRARLERVLERLEALA